VESKAREKIAQGLLASQQLREPAKRCRNFSVPMRDDTIYVTIDKTGRKVLP
jgi:hypothetical protein